MVAGDRSESTIRCLWEALPDVYESGAVVYSDFLAAYSVAIPEAQHVPCGKGDGMTCHVERFWCNVRQRGTRFACKTLSSLRCDLEHTGSLWLFICNSNASPREGHYLPGDRLFRLLA